LCLDGEKTEQLIDLFDNAIIFESDNSPMRVKQRIFDLRARFNRIPKNDLVTEDDDLLLQFNTKINSYQAISPNDRERASELFRKTNQFNFTFNRTIIELRIDKALALNNKSNPDIYVCELSDDISNSGIIAALAVDKLVDKSQIIELCISCRALGRGVEKYIVYSLLIAADIKPFEDIECNFVWNAKNLVAQSFAKFYFAGHTPIKLNYDSLELAVPNFRKFCKSQ
jgi:predicted enzyme involved in methoxymalonyl-ACP biosynthesis